MKTLLFFPLCLMLALMQATVTFDATEWDFGKVPSDGKTLFHTFKLTNVSQEEFRIGGFATSCSCVSAYIGHTKIDAGQTLDMEVSIRPDMSPGKKMHYVVLFGSGEKYIGRVLLKYEITDDQTSTKTNNI